MAFKENDFSFTVYSSSKAKLSIIFHFAVLMWKRIV